MTAGSAIRKGAPGQWTDNAVDHEPGALLETFHRRLCLRPKYAINRKAKIWGAPQRALEAADCVTGGARSDRRLTRIWHAYLLIRKHQGLVERCEGAVPR